MRTVDLPTAAHTHALGLALARACAPGMFVALCGDLGAGKSSLARAIARGLGVTGPVPSPTFVLVNTYEVDPVLVHADWYRLADADELEQLGFDELADGDAVAVVEWADRFPEALPADHLRITLTDHGEGRRAVLVATGPAHEALERVDV